MILSNLQNLLKYEHIHPGFRTAVDAIELYRENFSTVPEGRSPLGDSGCYCIKVNGEGRGKNASPLEAHRAYIDIQYTVEGNDIIGWKSKEKADKSSGYDEQNDIEFFMDCKVNTWFDVPKGQVAVFFPEDLHAPMACESGVKKLVIKVPVV